MPPGVGYPGKNSRYTPPTPLAQKSAGRQGAIANKVLGLGAANLGDSPTARRAQNKAFEKNERINAFDANRTGRATPKVRMVPGQGSTTTPVRIKSRPINPDRLPVPMSSGPRGAGSNLPARRNLPATTGGRTPMNPSRNLPARASGMGSTSGPRPINVGNINHTPQRQLMLGTGRTTTKGPTDPVSAAKTTTRSTGGLGDGVAGGASKMRNGRGLLIGMGAAVVAGLAYAGRRDNGTSSGRSSAYRY
jgi:hypothetical protein